MRMCRMLKSGFMGVLILLLVMQAPVSGTETGKPAEKDAIPLWEVKLMVAGFRIRHYRGSDEYETYTVPVPYFEYRGENFRTDREGLHGIFYRSDHFETNLSAFGNPPVEKENKARKDMVELDLLVELGPAVKWYPTGRKANESLYFQATARGVMSVNLPNSLKTAYQGIHGALSMVYYDKRLFGSPAWEGKATLGLDITDDRYNAYFYDVTENDALPERPVYQAGGGYGGMYLSGRLVRNLTDRLSISGYVRWENINGAVFEESPLVKTDNNVTVGAILTWIPMRSKKQVDAAYSDF